MSKSPFVITLLIFGSLLGWLYRDAESAEKERSLRSGGRTTTRIYGYPDHRGIVLQMTETSSRACFASTFRAESPDLALWDDGTVVFRNSTFDYVRSRISADQARQWTRTFQVQSLMSELVACEEASDPTETPRILLRGSVAGAGATIRIYNLDPGRFTHAKTCADCRPIRPLARMLGEMRELRRMETDESQQVTGLPVEVYLEWRSCGCRNHPEIVNVSKQWPLAGKRPEERCGKGSTRFRLEDPEQIRLLSETIARSAAVLDREDIYTCFMRPLLEPPKVRTLALR